MSPGRPAAVAAGLAALVAGAVALAWFQVCDTDAFWQLKVGEVMLDTGALIRSNLFSSAFADHPWFNPEWLFQVALAGAYRAGGWAWVAAFKMALVLALAALLFSLLLVRRAAPLAAASFTLAALAAMRTRLTERPQLASLLLFAALLLLLELARRGRPRLLLALPPIFALWGNLHPELLLGVLWIAGTAAGEWVDERLARRDGAASPQGGGPGPGRIALVALLCAVVSGANPGGYRVLWHPFPHFWQESLISLAEFRTSVPSRAPLLWVLIAAVAASACHPRRRRWAELLPMAGIGVLAVRYLREVPFFALVAAPFLHAALADLPPAGRRARALGTVASAALAAGFLVYALRFDHGLRFRWGYGVNEERFPVRAAGFILEERLPPNLYNHYNDGAYLLWRLWPRLGVFQDGRVSAYPPEFVARLHANRSDDDAEWLANLDPFAVNTAVVHGPEAPLLFPADRWQMVYRDRRYAVVVRRTAGTASLLRRLPAYPLR